MNKKKDINKAAAEATKHQDTVDTDKNIEESNLEIASVTFTFTFTRDEANAFINKPKSQVARNLRKYMCKIFEVAAKKMLDAKPDEIVKNCKLDIPDELK